MGIIKPTRTHIARCFYGTSVPSSNSPGFAYYIILWRCVLLLNKDIVGHILQPHRNYKAQHQQCHGRSACLSVVGGSETDKLTSQLYCSCGSSLRRPLPFNHINKLSFLIRVTQHCPAGRRSLEIHNHNSC